MGAWQFVNVVLFQFSGLASFLSAQSLLRSLSCTSSPANFFFSPLHRSQIPFDAAREKKFWIAANRCGFPTEESKERSMGKKQYFVSRPSTKG
jgi:hypothetical protein